MPASNAPRLKAPIVLVHGLLGFDYMRVGSHPVMSYWAGIPEALSINGTRVLVARVSPTAGIAQRAQDLQRFLDQHLPGEAVHLFAHSMGGLDSRYLISRLGMAPRILSLTTLGTPHRGTAMADWGLRSVLPLVRPMFDLLGLPWQAVPDLTVESCKLFNEQVPDVPGVRYFSVAGQFQANWRKWHFSVPERYLRRLEGPNDGLVSVSSATYGEDCQIWEVDHMDLVNWQDPVPLPRHRNRWDFPLAHVRLAQRLADEGF